MAEKNDKTLHQMELDAVNKTKISIVNFLARLKMDYSRKTRNEIWEKHKEGVKDMFPETQFKDEYVGDSNQNFRLLKYLRTRIKNGEIFEKESLEFRKPKMERQNLSELIKLVESGKNKVKRKIAAETMIENENWGDLEVLENQDVINAIWSTEQKRRAAIGKGINIGILLENRNSKFDRRQHPDLNRNRSAGPPSIRPPRLAPKTNEEYARDAKIAESLIDKGNWTELQKLTNQDVINAIWPNRQRRSKAEAEGLIVKELISNPRARFDKQRHPKLLPQKTNAEWSRDAERAVKLIDSKKWKELEQLINQDIVNAIFRTSRLKQNYKTIGLDLNFMIESKGLNFSADKHPGLSSKPIQPPKVIRVVPEPAPARQPVPIESTDERLNPGVEVKSLNDFVVIGDSNAARLADSMPESRRVVKSAVSSQAILKLVRENRAKIRGAKVAIIRVGRNDGNISAHDTIQNIEGIVQICIKEGVKDIRVLTRAPYVKSHPSRRLRRSSGYRRLATIEKFGNKTLPNGVKIAVLDAYEFLSDGRDNLKQEYAKDGGKLHMGKVGNDALAEWICGKLGVDHLLATPEKARRARVLVAAKKWEELKNLTNQDIINGIWGSRVRKEEAARNGIDLNYLLNNRYEKFDEKNHPNIGTTAARKPIAPQVAQKPVAPKAPERTSTPWVVIKRPSPKPVATRTPDPAPAPAPARTVRPRQVAEASTIAPTVREELKVGEQPEWNKEITLTFDDSLYPTLGLVERLEFNGITNYRIYGEFGTALKTSMLQKMGVKGNADSTKLTPGKWLSEWIDVKRGSMSRKEYIRKYMLKGPGDRGTDYLTMGTQVRDRFKKLYPTNWQEKLEETFGYHAAIMHPSALDRKNHIQFWTKEQIQEDVETYEEFMMAWLDISQFKVRHLRSPEGGGFGYSGAWRKGASSRNAQRLIDVVSEFRPGATWDMWNVDSNDVRTRGKINSKAVAGEAVRNLSRPSRNQYAPKGETLVLMHTKYFSGKHAWRVDNLSREMGGAYEGRLESIGRKKDYEIRKMGNAKVDNSFIRKSPEISNRSAARVIRKLEQGEPIFVKEQVPGMPDWYKVGWGKSGRNTGYIHRSQLTNVNKRQPSEMPQLSTIEEKMHQIKPQYRRTIGRSEKAFIMSTIEKYKGDMVEQNRDQYMVFVDRSKEYAAIIYFEAATGEYKIVGNFGAKTSTGRENPSGITWATPLGVYNLRPFTEKRVRKGDPEWRTQDSGGGGFGTYGSRVFHLGYVDVDSPRGKNASIAMHKTDRNSLKILGEKSKSHGCIRIADGLMDILDQNYLLDSDFGHHVIVGDSSTNNMPKYYQDHGRREMTQNRNGRHITRK